MRLEELEVLKQEIIENRKKYQTADF